LAFWFPAGAPRFFLGGSVIDEKFPTVTSWPFETFSIFARPRLFAGAAGNSGETGAALVLRRGMLISLIFKNE
jgi:hypothetical protein